MSRILVTGGAGFIGSNLVLELESQGHEVVAVDSFRTGTRDNLKDFRGSFCESDVTQSTQELSGKWDFVFHHGDITDPRHGSENEVLEKNVSGFRNLLQLCKPQGARFIYASTAGLYGNGPVPMSEDQPKDLLTAYGRSKLEMDELAMGLSGKMAIVGLRYFNVYGPREAHKGRAASMIYHLACQIKRGQRPRLFKFGDHRRDFIYVKDVVAANLCAMTAPSGVYNVGTGVGSTFNEVAQAVKAALGSAFETEYFDMPYDPASYQDNTQADITRATRDLRFSARWGLRDGVVDYMEWLRNNA